MQEGNKEKFDYEKVSRILIIEDEIEISNLISAYLKKNGHTVDFAITGEDGLLMLKEFKYDLLVLDINLPGIDGFEVLKQIRNYTRIPVVIVSARTEDSDMLEGFGLGADDFVCKPFSPKVLVARIESHLKRLEESSSDYKNGDVFKFGPFELDQSSFCLKKNRVRVKMRPKELELLIYLAKKKNLVVSGEELYSSIWGFEKGDVSTVTVHIRRIRDKIEENSANPKYLKTVYGKGYFLLQDE